MNETVICTGCQAHLVLPRLSAGQTVQCPRCRRVFEPFRQRAEPVAAVAPRLAEDDTDDEPRAIVRPLPLGGEKLAVTAMWLLGVCCVFFVIQLYLHIDRAWIVGQLLDREIFINIQQGRLDQAAQARLAQLEDQMLDSAERARTMVTLTRLAFWPTVVIYFMWLYRASRNLRLLQADGVSHTPGWAVLSYFVPFANLFRPYMQMQDIWRASDPEHIDHGRAWQKCPPAKIIGAWWISLILASVVALVGSHMEAEFLHFDGGGAFGNLQDQRLIARTYVIANLATLVAGSLLILIIRGITQRQRERYRRLYEDPA